MKTELIIRSNSSDIDFALLKDGKLIELNKETTDNKFLCWRHIFSQDWKSINRA